MRAGGLAAYLRRQRALRARSGLVNATLEHTQDTASSAARQLERDITIGPSWGSSDAQDGGPGRRHGRPWFKKFVGGAPALPFAYSVH